MSTADFYTPRFTNVRVPRAYMLMKHTQVTREGEVREPPLQQLTYGALLQGRTAMVADAANSAKKALTIGVRYAAVRRQFKSSPDAELETQLLDYPIHQRRLMPLLAQSVAFGYTALQMNKLFEETSSALEALEPGDPNLQATIELLKETHSTSAGLKAFCTWATLESIEKTRQACGGHGYSSYVGLAPMGQDFAVHCTWEGDNTILALQSGRALIAAYSDAKEGKKLASGNAYLNNLEKTLNDKCTGEAQLDTLDGIDQGWAAVAAHAVKKAYEDFEALTKAGRSRDQAFEECSQSRFVAASVHTSGYIFRQFRAAVEQVKEGKDGVRKHLEILCKFYGLWQMEEKAAFFLRSGWLSPELLDKVQAKVTELCAETRKFAIPLVDSFALHDHTINSPFGRYDGAVYTSYWRAVRRNNPQGKHSYWESTIKPFLHREDAEFEDVDEAIGIDEEIEEIKQVRLHVLYLLILPLLTLVDLHRTVKKQRLRQRRTRSRSRSDCLCFYRYRTMNLALLFPDLICVHQPALPALSPDLSVCLPPLCLLSHRALTRLFSSVVHARQGKKSVGTRLPPSSRRCKSNPRLRSLPKRHGREARDAVMENTGEADYFSQRRGSVSRYDDPPPEDAARQAAASSSSSTETTVTTNNTAITGTSTSASTLDAAAGQPRSADTTMMVASQPPMADFDSSFLAIAAAARAQAEASASTNSAYSSGDVHPPPVPYSGASAPFPLRSRHQRTAVLQAPSEDPKAARNDIEAADEADAEELSKTRCYWAVLSTAPASSPMSSPDSSPTFLYLDPVFAKHMGAQAEAMLGTSFFDYIHPEEKARAEVDMRNIIDSRTLFGSVSR